MVARADRRHLEGPGGGYCRDFLGDHDIFFLPRVEKETSTVLIRMGNVSPMPLIGIYADHVAPSCPLRSIKASRRLRIYVSNGFGISSRAKNGVDSVS
jgi:hypothetical protein